MSLLKISVESGVTTPPKGGHILKIHVLSDLHLEFADFAPPPTDADVVVLAGDIHVKARGVAWALKHFKQPVLYVPGNHEYYGGSLGHTFGKLKALSEGTSLYVLNDEELVLDGVRFLGATLWTDYRLTGNEPLAQWDAQQTMSDFKKVRDEHFRKVRPHQLSARHFKSKQFLQSAFEQPFDGPTVVVTHHAPCELSIHERYRTQSGGHLNASYASRLDGMMGVAKLWVHGHTHDNWDYDVYGTRVLCNPRGYAPDDVNEGFQPGLVVEI